MRRSPGQIGETPNGCLGQIKIMDQHRTYTAVDDRFGDPAGRQPVLQQERNSTHAPT
jgi:hypothetical protein